MLAAILGSGHWEGDLLNHSQSQSFQEQQLRQSLQLCTFVLDSIEGEIIAQDELHHAQRTLLLRSVIYRALQDKREWADLFRAVGLALNSGGPSRTPPYTIDHLILVAYFVGALACADQVGPGLEGTMKITDELRRKISPDFDVFDFVETNSDRLLGIVGKSPPILLLSPAEALYLPSAIWTPTHILSPPDSVSRFSAPGSFRDDTSAITGELLSTLAARIAEVARVDDVGSDAPGVGPFGNLSKFEPSLSVVLLLRYVGLGLAPSPQAFKAVGDLISAIEENVTRTMVGGETGSEMKLDVAGVAMLYYEFGMKTL